MADDKKPEPTRAPDPGAAAAAQGQPATYQGTPKGEVPKGPEQAPAQNTHTATPAEQASDTFGGPNLVAPMQSKRGGARERSAQQAQAEQAQRATNIDAVSLGAAIVAAQQQIYKLTSQQVGTPDIDRTIPNGIYIVDGRTVNAHGEQIRDPRADDDGKD